MGKSVDPELEFKKDAKEKEPEGEEKGTTEENVEGKDLEKKDKDDRDIFELIREEVENEKALLAEMGDPETETDDQVKILSLSPLPISL